MLNKRILVIISLLLISFLLVGCGITTPTIIENKTPEIVSVSLKTATVGVLYTYDVNATDPNGDTLIYSLINKPVYMTIDSTTGVIEWTPPYSTPVGDYPVKVEVSDGILSDTQFFNISVAARTPMEITVDLPTFTVGESAWFTINMTANDDSGKSVKAEFNVPPSIEGTLDIGVESDLNFELMEDVFSSGEFIMEDVTATFRGTFTKEGTYTTTLEVKTIPGNILLRSKVITIVVVGAVGPVYNSTQDKYYATITEAITDALADNIIEVAAGTYYEVGQIVIDKNLTIIGEDKFTTIIKPDHDTTVAGYVPSDAWIYVPLGITFALSNVTLDGTNLTGTPRIIRHAIQSRGELTVEDCIIKNIKTNNIYYGRGIVLLAGTSNTIARCEFSDIQRIGIHVRGSVESTNPIADIEDCTYIGKGDGDWLDYGIEFGGGGSGTVDGCDISDCTGVASTDSSTSAGILATDYYGTGTVVTVENSTLTGNSDGIAVGFAATDATVLTAHSNNFSGNDFGINNVGVTEVNAENNWWGDTSGPNGEGTGTGDAVSVNVDFDPWTTY